MTKPSDPGRGDDPRPEIADAYDLFGDEPARDERPGTSPPRSGGSEGYDLADAPEPVAPSPPPPTPPSPSPTWETTRPRRRRDDDDERETPVAPAVVEQVWSRGAEWGPDLGRIGGAILATLVVLYLSFNPDYLGLTFLLLLVGLVATAALSYPVLVTLERPVRVTPEQALQDYYDALSHWLPHHRRMWLLLSESGRDSPEFRDFASFRRYWKAIVRDLKAKAGGSAPLEFRVEDYKADKSAGKEALRARYVVRVFRAGPGTGGAVEPIATFRDTQSLTRGPDRMWYLDKGTLPAAG